MLTDPLKSDILRTVLAGGFRMHLRHTKRREFITLLGGAAVAWRVVAHAQPSRKYTLGYFSAGPATPPELWAVILEALREVGLDEGKNVTFERKYADNRLDRLPDLAADLVRLNVDVIVAAGTLAPLAAKRATSTIPIVMMNAGDPLGSGLVTSLARPGGNVTGMSLMAADLGGKRLELLKEVLPRASHVGILWNAANPYSALVFKETESAAQILQTQLQSIELRGPDDFDIALPAAKQQCMDALIIVEDPLTFSHRRRLADFAAHNRLPAIYGLREFVDAGGLMAYGTNQADLYRRGVSYIAKILKGVKPADLPVQQPTKFELVINLKTAKALGIEVPPTLLARADEVIE
jgi:putative tryptophan/tyrosine transport system substrate-binding protein